jgi:hypothetical protein
MLSTLSLSTFVIIMHIISVTSSPISKEYYESAMIKAMDRLLASHSPNSSAVSIYRVTSLGLLDPCRLSSDANYFFAAKATADYLLSLGAVGITCILSKFLIEFAKTS